MLLGVTWEDSQQDCIELKLWIAWAETKISKTGT